MKRGFTLIELLVVILIIGILAAVALPQYQKTVIKARFSNVLQVAESLAKAEEVYYMANGHYIADANVLDYDYKGSCVGNDVLTCDNFFYIDLFSGSGIITDPTASFISIQYCPGAVSYTQCRTDRAFHRVLYLNNSSKPGVRACNGFTEEGRAFCKTLNM